jgi:NADH:ubiquinone oxidoreductase subunit 6 (subunit J)
MIFYTFLFFAIKSDYIGIIIMIVYFGAIVIFFVFALMTIDPRHIDSNNSNNGNEQNINNNDKLNKINNEKLISERSIQTISFFFITYLCFHSHYHPLKIINIENNIINDKNFINNQIKQDSIFFTYEETSVHSLGKIMYTLYVYPINTLAIILIIALVCAIAVLTPNKKKDDNNNV